MHWYFVHKKIKGRTYLYRQRTYRVGGTVKTENQYLGPAGEATSGKVRVTGLDGEKAEPVTIIDRTTPEPPPEEKPSPNLVVDEFMLARSNLSVPALFKEEKQVDAMMSKLGVTTTTLKPIKVKRDWRVWRREQGDSYTVYGTYQGQRTAFKREFRRALAERWVDALRDQRPERYQRLCNMVGLELSWTNSRAEPVWLSLLSDLWHRRRRGHHAAVEMLAEMLQRGQIATQAKYYHEDGQTERDEISAWKRFERLKTPAARAKQFAEWKRLKVISTAAGIKHSQAIFVRAVMFDERPLLSAKDKKKFKPKRVKKRSDKIKNKIKRRYSRRRYQRWSR